MPALKQPEQTQRREVAQARAAAAGEDRCSRILQRRHRPSSDRVDAAVDPEQPSDPYPVVDCLIV
jgi:hypothetical protein